MGVYDAPEPWGPWTTVDFAQQWDVGPGESGCFPTKWMSHDGRTLFLVFSGDDCFSVRRAQLQVDLTARSSASPSLSDSQSATVDDCAAPHTVDISR
jgi:hypothetical protein